MKNKINLSKYLSNVVLLGLVFGVLCIIYFLILFKSYTYDELINAVLQNINRPDLKTKITQSFFTESKYLTYTRLVYPIITVFVLFLLLLIFFRKRLQNLIAAFFSVVFQKIQSCYSVFEQFSKLQKFITIGLFLIATIRGIYYIIHYPIQYDEAFNYNYFLHKNILYTIVAYNNYPLHNIISWLLMHTFSMGLFFQRLPSLLAGIAFLVVIISIVQKLFKNSFVSIAVGCIVAFMPVFVFYNLFARGVMFNLFFSAVLFYYLIKHSNELNLKRTIWLAILNALAMYSMVSHLYFIVIGFVYLISINKIFKNIRQATFSVLYLVLSIAFSSILFLPMYLGTGLSLGTNAAISASQLSFLQISTYALKVDYFLLGYSLISLMTIVLNIALLFVVKNNCKKIILFNILLLCLVYIVPLFTNITPPERSMSFVVLGYVFTMALLYKMAVDDNRPKFISILLGTIICIGMVVKTKNHNFLNWSVPLDNSAKVVAKLFMKKNINSCYNTSSEFTYFTPALQYYFLQSGKAFLFETNNKNSTRYSDEYNNKNCIVVDKTNTELISKLKAYKLIYAFNEFQVFYKE